MKWHKQNQQYMTPITVNEKNIRTPCKIDVSLVKNESWTGRIKDFAKCF